MGSSSSSSGGSIFAAVFITLLIVGAGAYFGLPYLYPHINQPYPDEDVVVQMKYAEFTSYAVLMDNEINQTMMNQTNMVIETQGNTFMVIEFNTVLKLSVTLGAYGLTRFKIALVMDGIGNSTVMLQNYNGDASSTSYMENYPFTLKFKTPILAAGNYTASIVWWSEVTVGGICYLAANYQPTYNTTRSLQATEYFNI